MTPNLSTLLNSTTGDPAADEVLPNEKLAKIPLQVTAKPQVREAFSELRRKRGAAAQGVECE